MAEHYRVIAPDTPGQGRSELPDSLSYEVLTEFASSFIDSLKLDSAYVMGWSDGGIVGILLAAKRPDKIRKAIAVGANNGKSGFALPPGILLNDVMPMTLNQFENANKALVDEYMKKKRRDWKKLVSSLNAMVHADKYFSDAIYAQIHIPTMIVVGDRDEISLEHAAETYHLIKGSQYCVLPNTTHEVFKEKPKLMTEIVMDFFK